MSEQEQYELDMEQWRAALPGRFRYANPYEHGDGLHEAQVANIAVANKYADAFDKHETTMGLFLFGPAGSGKTELAAYAAICVAELRNRVGWVHIPTIVEQARRNPQQGIMDFVPACHLLVMDDLGAERVTEFGREQLYLLLERRYAESRPSIITSNATLETIGAHLDDRIASRIAGMCKPVSFSGVPDYRAKG